MAIKPKKHAKLTVRLNDDPVTDVLTVEFQLGKGLRTAIASLADKQRENCKCEVCRTQTWDHFLVNTFCFALEDALQEFLEGELQEKFKGNTSIISKAVN